MKYALIMLALLLVAHAEDMVVINSFDGRDVLSGVFYANVIGVPVKFMPSQGADDDLFSAKIGSGHDILLIQSANTPVSGFVENNLKTKNKVELYSSSDGGITNLALAKRSGATSFIIVESAYSDSALSVISYAKLTKSYVILADKDNAAQMKELVHGKKVTVFGLVDKDVTAALADENPQFIGKGEDKYEDNVAMVSRTLSELNINRMIISEGTSLEESMTVGDQPILFSGRLVPQPTYDFIKQSVRDGKLVQVMLIGNDLVVPIYDMRERMKKEFAGEGLNKTFGIIVKFAQIIPSAGSSALVLDTFKMPAYQPLLNVTDVVYNKQSGKVMVTLDNIGEGPAYYTLEFRVKANGQDIKAFPVGDPVLISRGEQKGLEYQVDLSGITEGSVTYVVIAKYGPSKKSLEEFISTEGPLATINYVDKSNISVQFARYDREKKVLRVTIRNDGDAQAFVFPKLTLVMQGAQTTISAPSARAVDPASMAVEEFPLELSDADLSANKNVTVTVDYGGRQGFLVKHIMYIMPLEDSGGLPLPLMLAAVIIVIAIAAVAYYLFRGGSKKR